MAVVGSLSLDPFKFAEMCSAGNQACVRGDTAPARGGPDMARKFADAADIGIKIDNGTTAVRTSRRTARSASSGTPRSATAAAASVDRKQRLAYSLGVQAARQLAWKRSDYTREELTALGKQLAADHAIHGNTDDRMRLLAALATATGDPASSSSLPDSAAPAAEDHDMLADRIHEFLLTNFHEEFAVSHAAADLAALRPPARAAAASDEAFSRSFDAYVQAATDKTLVLLDKWLSWIGAQRGTDLKDANMEIQTVRLDHYKRALLPSLANPRIYERKTGEDIAAKGYILTIHSAEEPSRFFLSTADGGVHPIPGDESTMDWLTQHQETVFNVQGEMSTEQQRPNRTRVVWLPLGKGVSADSRNWLAAPLRARFEQSRPAGQQQQPQPAQPESAIDKVLDFIPFGNMLIDMRDGRYKAAAMSGTVDALTLAIPMLCSGLRLAIGAAREAGPAMRAAGRALVEEAMTSVAAMPAAPADLRTVIKAALRSATPGNGLVRELRPLDVDSMAAALRDSHPRVANALERAGERARGIGIPDDWRLVDKPAASAAEQEIGILDTVTARSDSGDTVPLLPYGKDSARAYTHVTPTGERAGAILLADAEGRLHPSLPADTLERYRITDTMLRHELDTVRPGADGVISLRGKNYARIVDEHVEIAHEHASTRTLKIWRVVAPEGTRRDVVLHRIAYDPDKQIWRRTEIGSLKGGGIGPSSCRNPCLDRGARTHPERDGQPAHAAGSSLSSAAADAIPLALPSLAPGAADVREFKKLLLARGNDAWGLARTETVRNLLDKAESDPRGKAILNAMCAYHELTGRAPEIVLRGPADLSPPPRPSLDRPMRGLQWHLDLDALKSADRDTIINEMAAVYNNMTGILRGNTPFAAILRGGGPPLTVEEETALTRWVGADKGRYSITDPSQFLPSPRQIAADNLRQQIRLARCHGGLDKTTLMRAMRNLPDASIPGLRVDLSNMQLTDIPPLPADVHTLSIHDNPIEAWRHLPRNLQILDASKTGDMATLLDYLPPGLRELDLSDNYLGELPGYRLPRGLTRLTANDNLLTEIPAGLPNTLRQLTIADNRLTTWPPKLPRNLRALNLSGNRFTGVRVHLPANIEELDLSRNLIRSIGYAALPPFLSVLDLSDNPALSRLPSLPETIRILYLESTGLTRLPENLPGDLLELYASDLGLRRLPRNLPTRLAILSLSRNLLTELPSSIVRLTRCNIYLDDNPITYEALPRINDDRQGPAFHLSSSAPPSGGNASRTVMQAVRRLLPPDSEAIARWEAIAEQKNALPVNHRPLAQFRDFLDRLRRTTAYRNRSFQADIQEWLTELSNPERTTLLQNTLEMCDGATETCDDRIVWTLNELRKLRVHDDIRLGYYNERPADALQIMRELFRLQKLQDIAYRKVGVLRAPFPLREIDEIEIYLAYIVKLREPLSLSLAPLQMDHFAVSRITRADLTAAQKEVLEAERAEFYQHLVVDDTWNGFIMQQLPERFEQAQAELIEQAESPLQERVYAELRARGLDPNDADAYRNIAPYIWRDMKYDILEPLTRDYLAAQEIASPKDAANAAASG